MVALPIARRTPASETRNVERYHGCLRIDV